MESSNYLTRRQQLTTYFDQTAAAAWKALTSDTPVSKVRQTVRAGRDAMRSLLLSQLPQDLRGTRVLDAGCGTGAFAFEAARRGADVLAIDVAENLIDVARERMPADLGNGCIEFLVGDMSSVEHGEFDHVVAMDSLIHYDRTDIVEMLDSLGRRTRRSMHFTFAPRTAALAAMHFVGRLIPHSSDRAPAIIPVGEQPLQLHLAERLGGEGWEMTATQRIKSGFYISQAMELRRRCDA
jgi:magnesium-protoporphyrin O-methyltransferase